MAIGGSFYGTTGNSAIKPKITWSAQENIEGNYSDVTAKLSYSRTDSYTTYGHWEGTLTINGNKKSVSGKYVEITKNSNTVTITHTVQVPHEDDGTKTITISATGKITDTTLTKTNISGSVTLVSIPRAASVAATDADIGGVSVVTIGKKSDSYAYTVAYQFGALSGYLTESGLSQTPAEVTAASLAFPLPEAFYYEIPDKTAALCTLTCTTFLDGQVIGANSADFTVRAAADRCGPVMAASVADINGATLALTGNECVFIRYASTAWCDWTVQTRYGAVITEKTVNGETAQEQIILPQVEDNRLFLEAADSRGHRSRMTLALDLIPYFLPTLRLSAARTDATSGNAVLQAEGSFFHESFGAVSNSLRAQYRIGDGQPVEVTPQTDGSSYTLTAQLQDLDYTQSHLVTVTVSDALSAVTAQVQINPGIPVFEWGKGDVQFHVPVFVQGKNVLEGSGGDCVSRTGDTMSGDLAMDGNRVTNLGTPEAETDAATKAYVDGRFAFCKLWENASPTSAFAAQTLETDLAGFSMILVGFTAVTSDNYPAYGLIPRQRTGKSNIITATRYDSATYTVQRNVKVDFDSNTIEFSTARQNDTEYTGRMIPQVIWGIKGETE